MITASAPGKIILVGEHAVVYGRPALAVPVWETRAEATICVVAPDSGCRIVAPQIGLDLRLVGAAGDEPLALAVHSALREAGGPVDPDWMIRVTSSIPIASGLGSGAAISAAIIRVVFAQLGRAIDPATVSRLVFATERLYHGTPSGIDNSVIAYGLPIWFVKGEPPEQIVPGTQLTLAIADSGIAAPTKETVADVRRRWQTATAEYEAHFDAMGAIAVAARAALETGDVAALGRLLRENQSLLVRIGVSSAPLERLVETAEAVGAYGAKLSGGGRGGNVIALIETGQEETVRRAWLAAGAQRVIVTRLGKQNNT